MNNCNCRTSIKPIIAILGGTGKQGKGLAYRWIKSGYPVIIGSRSDQKAIKAVEDVKRKTGDGFILSGMKNAEAASQSDIVVMTVPYKAHRSTLEDIRNVVQGKIFVDVTVPLNPPEVTRVHIPPNGSAGMQSQLILGDEVFVVSALQNISHDMLFSDRVIRGEVLVCGNNAWAKDQVIQLVADAGLVAWDAGPLENAVVVEGLTPILIGLNKRYGCHNAGIVITGPSRTKSQKHLSDDGQENQT